MSYVNLSIKIDCINEWESEAITAAISDLLETYEMRLHSTESVSLGKWTEENLVFYPKDM